MTEQEQLNYYNKVLDMADAIVEKIGDTIMRDGYYNDTYEGSKFEYEKLKIYKSAEDFLTILINGKEVFNYSPITEDIYYIEGEWPELISAIYDEVPNILKKREEKREITRKKVQEMKSLENYLKDYIRMYNKDGESIILANTKLYEKEIQIKKEEKVYYRDTRTEYHQKYTYYVFSIYYQGEKVMEFRDNINDVLPNIEYSPEYNEDVLNYKPGEWTKILKQVMTFVSQFDQEYTEQEINISAKQMMKGIKRIK